MIKRFSFTYKIITTLLVILTLVGVTGIYAYQQFSSIVSSISNDAQPNMVLITSKALMNDLIDAENSAKSFSLTKDTVYLDQFYVAAESVDESLNKFYDLTDELYLDKVLLDSLDVLISKKFNILNELLLIQDQFRVQTALDKVVNKIDQAIVDDEPDKQKKAKENSKKPESSTRKSKKRIFGWLFKKSNKDSLKEYESVKAEASQQSITHPNEKVKFSKINSEVQKVKREEKYIESALKEKELALIVEDKEITKKIQSLVDNIEAYELLMIEQKTKNANLTLKNSNRQIALFCILTGILLVFMAYIIINYIQNNNKYRKALKRAKAKAEELATTKEKFLANISHEIRTPMNAIAGFTEQLSQSKLNKQQNEQLTMVRKSVEHLLYLINDVLDYTKLEAGKLKLERISFNLKDTVQDVITFIGPLAEEKNLKIKSEMKGLEDLILLGDPFRLRQVLLNLLSNAIKFTSEGQILVSVSRIMENENSVSLRFMVEDTGIGMNEKFLEKIFQEFEQAEESTTRNYGGTGLGLSIVKMLVNLHRGSIEVESKEGEGTNVIFELPYKISKSGMAAPSTNDLSKVSLPEKLKVLVVDDEVYNRKLLIAILKKHGVFYTEAETGKEAINELERNYYDLILMDARMPEMNGLEAAKVIRALENAERKDVPIIALTAAVTKEDRMAYQKAGMNGFLAKPFKEDELILEIYRVLKIEPNQNKTMKENEALKDGCVDFTDLKKLSAGDTKFYIEMLQTFVNTTKEALSEIESANQVDDWEIVAEYAHKASSPCKHLAANNLYKNLKKIEMDCRNNESLDGVTEEINSAKIEFKKIVKAIEKELSAI